MPKAKVECYHNPHLSIKNQVQEVFRNQQFKVLGRQKTNHFDNLNYFFYAEYSSTRRGLCVLRDMCAASATNDIIPQSPRSTGCGFVPYDESSARLNSTFRATVVAKGSSDGLSSSSLKNIKLIKKDTSTPWYDTATPVRSNGRSHPIELRSLTQFPVVEPL